MSNNIKWVIIGLIALTIILLYSSKNNELYDTIRKKKEKKHKKSKRILLSKSKNNSTNLLAQKLKNKLVQKSQNNLNNKTSNKPKYIVKLFYTNECYYCNQFKPTWIKVKHLLNKHNIHDISLEDVDCTNRHIDYSYIKGYPTIAVYNKNNTFIETYEGDRSDELFLKYLLKLRLSN